MLIKTTIALALVLATASGALAAPKKAQHSANPAWDVYDGRTYLGSDPDSRVRSQLMWDRGADF